MITNKVKLVVVGSIGLDTIETPREKRTDVLGGSVSYACATASFFARVGMVGVVGADFPAKNVSLFKRFGIDLQGLKKERGRTFRWSGVYERNMNHRRTVSTELNVFASFSPQLPPAYCASPFLFLANIAPDLQLQVLSQMQSLRLVAADTMDLWIRTARRSLMKVISRVHVLLINDSEARELTGEDHLIKAAKQILAMGPRYVIVKKGEHGSMLVSKQGIYLVPAYPVDEVRDPTGAGDSFAGGMMGYLAGSRGFSTGALKQALIQGTVAASFSVEAFSLERLVKLRRRELERRLKEFQEMVRM